jgi:hypothetical protein
MAMRTKVKKTLLVMFFVFLGLIVYLWYKQSLIELFIENGTDKSYCVFVDNEFKTIAPPGYRVRLRLKSKSNTKIAASETLKGLKAEEFVINLGGKYAIYNIFGLSLDKKNPEKSKKIIRITDEEPEKWISKLSIDNLHRIIMNQLPEKYKDLRIFKPEDGIEMIGNAKIEASLEYLYAILKQPKERAIWPETLEAISKIGGYSAQRTIQTYLYYEDLDIKIGAINAAIFLEPKKASRLLIKLYGNEEDKILQIYILKKLLSIAPNSEIQKFIKTEFRKKNPKNVLEMLHIIESHSYTNLAKDLQNLLKSNKSIRSDKQLNKEISTLLRTLENKQRSYKDERKKASRPTSTTGHTVHD